jgi:hypothetical protein
MSYGSGDNDNLSALIANLIDADLLIILTDQPGLFTSDPRKDENAQLIPVVERIDENTMRIAGGTGTNLGTGGMATKIEAAKLATNSGVTTIIARGREQNVVTRIVEGESIGTRFEPQVDQLESRKRWLLAEKPRGMIYVDEGAARALVTGGVSLLAVGVVRVEGNFERGALVAVVDSEAHKLAHGLASYNADDLRAIGRQKSNRIPEILGYTLGDAVIHRNNMVLFRARRPITMHEVNLIHMGERARLASRAVGKASHATRTLALEHLSSALEQHRERILEANALDVAEGKENGLSESLLDRLNLAPRLTGIIEDVRRVSQLADPIGARFDQRVFRKRIAHLARARPHRGLWGDL